MSQNYLSTLKENQAQKVRPRHFKFDASET